MSSSFWNERFAAAEYVYGENPNGFLAAHAAAIPPGPVLCLADGEGRNGVFLATQGHAVTSVDSSDIGLAKARQLAAKHHVVLQTIHRDLADYVIEPGHWSGIVAIFAHLPPPLRRSVHAAAVRGLRPGGVFLLEAYTPAQLALGTGGPRDPALLMTVAALTRELAGLNFDLAQETERDVTEGTGHTGRAAVVQILARQPRPPAAPPLP